MKKSSTRLLTALLVSGMLCSVPSVAFAQDTSTVPSDETTVTVPDSTEPELSKDDTAILPEETPDTEVTTPAEDVPDISEDAALPAEDVPQVSEDTPEVSEDADDTNVAPQAPLTTFSESRYRQDGYWRITNGRWWFQFTDGTYAQNIIGEIDGVIYAFDASGYMVTGWFYYNEVWYYFGGSGVMYTGWLYLSGTWYYLDPDYGFMYSNDIFEINGVNYAFHANGAMANGWYPITPDGSSYTLWFYFENGCNMYEGWHYIGNAWYYFSTDGLGWMYSDGIYQIDNNFYGFNSSGAMATGWYYYNDYGSWHYFNANGTLYDGWLYDNGKWYYFSNAYMFSNEVQSIDGKLYLFTTSGAMAAQPGWAAVFNSDGSVNAWYYVKNTSGELSKGWVVSGGYWYYLDTTDGHMYYGCTKVIDGKSYTFDNSGRWIS